jgi:hypothetical protein
VYVDPTAVDAGAAYEVAAHRIGFNRSPVLLAACRPQ